MAALDSVNWTNPQLARAWRAKLERRTFLRGAGTVLALPLLEAMLPADPLLAAEKTGAKLAPTRLAFVFFPNGAIMPAWTPKEAGKNFSFSETLEPLAKFKDELLVISGLAQDNGRAKGDGPGDHARSASTFLTGEHPVKTSGANIKVGISADQLAAEQIGSRTRFPSLELGIEQGRTAGNCDSGYSCAYSSCISWKTPTTPMAKEINPRLVFERLFGGDKESAADLVRRNKYRRSILDLVADDAEQLKEKLGQTDRRKVDEYFTSVRELERRIQQSERDAEKARPDFTVPQGVPRELQDHIRLMYDLLALSFRTDTTRVATFMLANEGSNRTYSMVGVKGAHHEMSHHRNEESKIADLKKIDRFLVEQFAYFLAKLQATDDGAGSLLDHSLIVYGSGLGDGNRHNHHDLPVLVAGRGNQTLTPGRHLKLGRETPLNNLFLSLLERVGAKADRFGDSSGPLELS